MNYTFFLYTQTVHITNLSKNSSFFLFFKGDGVVNVNESNVYNLSDTNGDGKVTWKEVQTYDINLSNQQRKEALLDWEQSEDDVNLFNKVMNKFNTFQQQDTTLKTTCPVTNNITHLGTDAILDLLRTLSPEYMKLVDEFYSFDIVATPLAAGRSSSKHWSNPLATALPLAPNMAIVCMYGVNKPTERAYVYRERGVGKECRGERNGVEIDDDVNVGKFGNGVRCDWSGKYLKSFSIYHIPFFKFLLNIATFYFSITLILLFLITNFLLQKQVMVQYHWKV